MVANFGLMGWLGMPIDLGAATAAAMAIGVGADYEIYLLFRFREELERSGNILTDRKSTRLNSSHTVISYAVFCLRSEEHTSELQSHSDLVCRLLLENRRTHV